MGTGPHWLPPGNRSPLSHSFFLPPGSFLAGQILLPVSFFETLTLSQPPQKAREMCRLFLLLARLLPPLGLRELIINVPGAHGVANRCSYSHSCCLYSGDIEAQSLNSKGENSRRETLQGSHFHVSREDDTVSSPSPAALDAQAEDEDHPPAPFSSIATLLSRITPCILFMEKPAPGSSTDCENQRGLWKLLQSPWVTHPACAQAPPGTGKSAETSAPLQHVCPPSGDHLPPHLFSVASAVSSVPPGKPPTMV